MNQIGENSLTGVVERTQVKHFSKKNTNRKEADDDTSIFRRKKWNSTDSSSIEVASSLSATSSSSQFLSSEEVGQMANLNASKKTTASQLTNCFLEVSVRLLLFTIFVQLERSPAFKRTIHPEELWLYKNPPTKDYVPASILMPASFILPFTIICLNFLLTHDKYDFMKGINVISLAIPLNGVLTGLLKITVGRPRPDFFYRCFPDGVERHDLMSCTGEEHIVNEGRKSFPSGHSSFAFTGFGFIFLYLAAKLHCFNERGRGQSWRLCITFSPLFIALLVAISRTCDYHHHWQDVTIGSIIGMLIASICYRQYYPSIFSLNCHRPYKNNSNTNLGISGGKCYVAATAAALNDESTASQSNDQTAPLINNDHNDNDDDNHNEKTTKWI